MSAYSRLRTAFARTFYPSLTVSEFMSFRGQMTHEIKDLETLETILALSDAERKGFAGSKPLPFSLTPYSAFVLSALPKDHPLRKVFFPSPQERNKTGGETMDPLGEEPCKVTPCLIHRYTDRALFLVSKKCAGICRYCTRARVFDPTQKAFSKQDMGQSLSYIETHPEIRDVLISGGDPLTLPDETLDWLLSRLKKIESVKMIRIGTKIPVSLPYRITKSLAKILKKYPPLYLSIHATHADEITPDVMKALKTLAESGVVMGSQTVLLKNVNDNAPALKSLFHTLLENRVRPYYLLHCDPIEGSGHFRVPVKNGLEILKTLRSETTGYAIPAYAVDLPNGGGKIVLSPEYVQGYEKGVVLIKDKDGKTWRYPDGE